MTQRPSVFPARGNWSGRLDSRAGGGHQSRIRTLQAQTMSYSEVGSDGWGQWADLLQSDKTRRRPITTHLTQHGQEKTNHCAPYPTWPCRLTYGGMVLVTWNTRRWQCRAPSLKGAHLLRQVRRIRKRREGNKQIACLVIRKRQLFRLSSHSGMLRDFERRNPSYRSSWKGREWTSSAFRKPTWQMLIASPLEGTSSSGMTEQIDTREE